MKKMVCLVMTAMMLAMSVPAIAAEPTKAQKDECMLASKECVHEVQSLQQKVKKLDAEIKKGKKVYSAEDLKKLNAKLKEAEALVDTLSKTP